MFNYFAVSIIGMELVKYRYIAVKLLDAGICITGCTIVSNFKKMCPCARLSSSALTDPNRLNASASHCLPTILSASESISMLALAVSHPF